MSSNKFLYHSRDVRRRWDNESEHSMLVEMVIFVHNIYRLRLKGSIIDTARENSRI